MVARAVLNTPITPGDAADLEALEATRKEMLATAKKLADTEAALREERAEAAGLAENFDKQDRDCCHTRAGYPSTRRAPAAGNPKEQHAKSCGILKKKEEVDINYLRVASAMQPARRILRAGWNPIRITVSTTQKDAHADRHPDDESHTGSSERRRRTREHPNPIPVPSKTPSSDPRKGKDAMYSGRDKYRNPSPPPNGYPRPPRRRSPAGNTRPRAWWDCYPRQRAKKRNRERSPEPRRNQNNVHEPEPGRSRNEDRGPEPRGTAIQNLVGAVTQILAGAVTRSRAGTTRAASARAKAATGAGASTRKAEEIQMAEARSRTAHLAGLPHHHLAVAAEVEAEAMVQPGSGLVTSRRIPSLLVDLKNAFEKHFRGTYKRPATTSDLQACIQKKGETSRNFLTRWLACRNECENVDNRTAMHAFIGGLQRGGLLRHKLTCMVNANQLTLDDMITIASDHTAADDDAGDLAATAIPLHQQKKNRDNGSGSSHKRKNPMTRRVADPRWSPWRFNAEVREGAEDADVAESGGQSADSAHHAPRKPTREQTCPGWPIGSGGKGKNKDKEEDSSEAMDEDDNSPDPKAGSAGKSNPFDKKSVGAYHTFLGTPTKDHPAIVPKECYALVVSPRIDGYDFSKCLMDGGASLNIMYMETLERMNLTKEQQTAPEFHGVVPGKKANSLGSITLPVAFGDVHNFREEKITFEVVPFKSSYHVIFGRPTYHKFHARACYIYNKLKIPGPKELKGYRAAVDPTEMQTTKKQISEQKTSFKAAIETKKHDLIKGDSSKQVLLTNVRCSGAEGPNWPNVHAYVDDIAVMTRKGSDLIGDLTKPSTTSAATNKVISLVIVVERKEEGHEYDVQRPVYYISEVLTESKQRLDRSSGCKWRRTETWVMHFDGSSSIKAQEPSHPEVSEKNCGTFEIHLEATNNMAEYEALLHGLRIAKEIGIKHIICCGDSDLVAQQVAGT
ncbi:hypothetical protein QYE76_060554 [Lolium multiflorum]|uniref:RNase H type-1 domain-containing protein n=1 Tax=Lolium multiflorum TaxID=4521 RepID=A0AAD8RZB0_LOLMU|nr:hypothetical protein QYE76_060554 [Lolium multiflorum]